MCEIRYIYHNTDFRKVSFWQTVDCSLSMKPMPSYSSYQEKYSFNSCCSYDWLILKRTTTPQWDCGQFHCVILGFTRQLMCYIHVIPVLWGWGKWSFSVFCTSKSVIQSDIFLLSELYSFINVNVYNFVVFSLFWWFLLPFYPLFSVFLIMCFFSLCVLWFIN